MNSSKHGFVVLDGWFLVYILRPSSVLQVLCLAALRGFEGFFGGM
jgi:hypothetical protein